MLHLLLSVLSGLALVGLWLLAELFGEAIGAVVWRVLQWVYRPPHGYGTLALTWAAILVAWWTLTHSAAEPHPLLAISAVFGTGLGLVAVLTLRDARRERRGRAPVVMRVPRRFSWLGRAFLLAGGLCSFGVAALGWTLEGSAAWETVASGLLFGGALMYGGITARLPTALVRVLGARYDEPDSLPPAG